MNSFIALCGIIILMAFAVSSSKRDDRTIQFSAIIHRHGDRSPMFTYPKDPHINYKWIGGPSALSPTGSHQMYILGRNMRARCHRLLPSDGFYTNTNMQVRSSPRERTLMSSESFLAGFMPPPVDQNRLPLLWQPVPIHSTAQEFDNVILQENPCPRYDQLYAYLMENPQDDLKRFYEENAETFAYLSEHTGQNISNVVQAKTLWDILSIEKNVNLTLPAWTNSVFPDALREMAELGFTVVLQTPYMAYVKGSPLVKEIFEHMVEKQNRNDSRSIYIYSGHDSTILSVLTVLNLTNQTGIIQRYGASLAFELHCDKSTDCLELEVRIQYFSRFDVVEPRQLDIPHCPAPCMLNQFAKAIGDVLDFDYADNCKQTDNNY